jgi:hypothetical protein
VKTLLLVSLLPILSLAQQPGTRVLLDAHNCYPQEGKWVNRIERALSTGVPLAIEQDLYLLRDTVVVAHDGPPRGPEPSLKQHFFERIRPIMDKASAENKQQDWPLIVLNLDFKSNDRRLLEAVWRLLREYDGWIATAPRGDDIRRVVPITMKPLLVLTGDAEEHERVFYDEVPVGEKLLVFGAARITPGSRWDTPPEMMVPAMANNYRRWWNNPWSVVEKGGQNNSAGDWKDADEARLKAMVDHAHRSGYWIRFYTLNGYTPRESEALGTTRSYNFRSLDNARARWHAAIRNGVDFVATDMYEQFATELNSYSSTHTSGKLR